MSLLLLWFREATIYMHVIKARFPHPENYPAPLVRVFDTRKYILEGTYVPNFETPDNYTVRASMYF